MSTIAVLHSEFLFHPHDSLGDGYLRWQPVSGAASYDLDYSINEVPPFPPPGTVEIRGLVQPCYQFKGLSGDEQVNWRVRTVDEFGNASAWVERRVIPIGVRPGWPRRRV